MSDLGELSYSLINEFWTGPVGVATKEYLNDRIEMLRDVLEEPETPNRSASLGNDSAVRGRISELREILALFNELSEMQEELEMQEGVR